MDYTGYLATAKTKVGEKIAARDQVQKLFDEQASRLENIDLKEKALLEANFAISFEVEDIQKTLKEDIDSLVTIAIQTVYDREIAFALSFDRKPSGGSDYKPCLIENGEEFNPKDEQCGGVLDVISYAMRIVLKGFESEKTRDFFWFDEPLKFLGGGLLAEKAAEMMKKINDELGIQSAIISHDSTCIRTADKIYHTIHDGMKSEVKEVFSSKKRKPVVKRIKATGI
jgi:hypothetical protein